MVYTLLFGVDRRYVAAICREGKEEGTGNQRIVGERTQSRS